MTSLNFVGSLFWRPCNSDRSLAGDEIDVASDDEAAPVAEGAELLVASEVDAMPLASCRAWERELPRREEMFMTGAGGVGGVRVLLLNERPAQARRTGNHTT
jgi:hypothetical protein